MIRRRWTQCVRSCPHANRPMVLDADALKAVGGHLGVLKGKTGVLTPHHRELELLVGHPISPDMESRMDSAKGLAAETGWTVLLKGTRRHHH